MKSCASCASWPRTTTITIDEAVAASEQRTGFRNAALANYMKSFGVLENPVDYTLGVYFHHCAIAMSCRQLAMAGRFLAHLGRDPSTGFSVVQPERARRINAVMLTCGHYDGSGEFAYRVGLPGKSGVGGGILAIAPGKASIAVWSPGLDASGNSHLGRIALEALTKRMGWSIFGYDAPEARWRANQAPDPGAGHSPPPCFRLVFRACRKQTNGSRRALVLTASVGLVNCFFVVPAAADRDLGGGFQIVLGSRLGCFAANGQARAPPNRELIDLRRGAM